ncbi:MAG TPA: arginase family protein [Hyphomicrobiaceae bacterium]|nr:arginase family protein [Hyphomicrobiaceae bacterium]
MQTFLGLPEVHLGDVASGQIVIVGAAHATPYVPGKPSHSEDAPSAIRAASAKFSDWINHHDFDTGSKLLGGGSGFVDAGNLGCSPDDAENNRVKIEVAIRHILAAGAVPMVIGGDDSVPIPVLGAYSNEKPIWILQIDAHIDWRDERFGEPLGWSSTMRRASEMGWVEGIVQAGIRGVGSALGDDVAFAEAWGAHIVTARAIHRSGIAAALNKIPQDARVFVTLDCDALDPSVMPGVMAQVPGGLTYWHIVEIFEGLQQRNTIVGFDIVELAPQRDIAGISALTAGRIICVAGCAIRKSMMR